jgi:hypothetical protein
MADEFVLKPGIARDEEGGRLHADLDRALTDKLLAQSDAGGALARDFEAGANLMLPTFDEIDRRMAQADRTPQTTAEEVESLLALDSVEDLKVEGMRLNDLLDHGDISPQERAAIKRGLVFLRNRRHAEAAEWWTLHRPKDALANPRFYCLTSLLLAFTYQLAGQTQLARTAAQEAVAARRLL